MSVKIRTTDNYVWTNEHNSITRQVLRRYQVDNEPGTGWRSGLEGIQSMLGEVRARTERVRSYGGKWSLSDVAVCNDTMHDSKPLTFFGTVGAGSIKGTPLFKDRKPLDQRLFFFQSGAQINQINNVLEERGLCLATTGASNGQTIAGAVSTGTHGSALAVGSMQDYVHAVHLVTGAADHVMVQPRSNAMLRSSFSDVFGAQHLEDDRVFDSARVSFGSFGVIHGLVVEAVSLFMLESHTLRLDYRDVEDLYGHLESFDHAVTRNLSRFLLRHGLPSSQDPYHVDIIVNPYSTTMNTYLRVMYRKPYDRAKLSPEPSGGSTRVGDDILSLIGTIADNAGMAVPLLVNELFGSVSSVQAGYTQTPRNIFGDSTIYRPRNGGASTELGVPIGRAAEAVRLILNTARQSNFAGLLGIRFVKNSRATLAFTRFSPLTCTIELPGLNSVSTQNFYRQVYAGMDAAGIPFTLHWGQEGDYSPKRLDAMYGPALSAWVEARKRVLPDPLQRYMFTNDFLKRCGLSEPPQMTGGTVIV